MLRLFGRSLEFLRSSELYEPTDENDPRLLFFSESVSRFLGGVIDTLGDLRPGGGERLFGASFRVVGSLEARLGDGDRDIPVDILETEADDTEVDLIRFDAP